VQEAGSQDAFCRDEEACVVAEAPLEADLPADLTLDRPPPLSRDSPGDRTGRGPARLQQQQWSGIEKRRRDSRRLPRTSLRDEHERARLLQRVGNPVDVRVNWKRFQRTARVSRT
jgi:hypothetical protein